MEKMEPQELPREALLLTILRIDVIMRKLETFFELEDLKCMRLVSTGTNQVILWLTKLVSKSTLVLKKRVYESPCFKTITFRPKNVAFETIQVESDDDVSKREEIIQIVCKLVESCEYLEIRESGWLKNWVQRALRECRDDLDLDDICLPKCFPPVLDVILSITNLKELICGFGSQVLLNKATEEHENALSGLKKLRFGIFEYELFDTTNFSYCPPIFLKLKGLMTFLAPPCDEENFQDTYKRYHERCRDVVVNNRETLIELHLIRHCEICCSKFFVNEFPSLKYLRHCSGQGKKNESLETQFLGNHTHQLEALTSVERADSGHPMGDVIRRVLFQKKLELMFPRKLERRILLNYLTLIRNSFIEDFKLETPYAFIDTEEKIEILSLLPTSLRSLIVTGNYPPLTYDYSKLKHFPHLAHLKLEAFVGPLNSTLEAIFKYLVKLRSLYIYCDADVTEAESSSVAERGANPTGSPILRKRFALKDLESFTIDGRGTISMDLINGMNCPKLKSFSISPRVLQLSSQAFRG